ncbi:toll/interleukin-1 receptor domain-containing protein [Algivirga pacifica]|uniref:TIR domain-containing protein n=1 Tax=Algivirga pacifica TaxID=1162670 RepID=A0ABP9DBN7_9BACT
MVAVETNKTNILLRDVFISYGRGESMALVARLHQQLMLEGVNVWFDKVNIAHGEDYQLQIDHGIERADNFIFVIAPHSIRSIYCLIELGHAIKFGKRIIPIVHVMPDSGDWKHAVNELRAEGKASQAKEVESWLEVLSKTDWIYAREHLGDIKVYNQWREDYENHWKKHDNLVYLNEWKCPIQWSVIDELEGVIQKIESIIKVEQAYVQ